VLFRSVFAGESFNRSQAFFAGRVANVQFECIRVDGRCIDEVDGLPEIGRHGSNATSENPSGYSADAAEADIVSGVSLHPAINHLAMAGWSKAEIEVLMHTSAARVGRPREWQTRFDRIERSIQGANRYKEREAASKADRVFAEPVSTPAQAVHTPAPISPLTLPVLHPNHFASRPVRERAWMVDPIIPQGETTLVYGPGSAGKSLMLLQLVLAVATDTPWLGKRVPSGRALFFTCEDDADEINRRSAKILASAGKTWSNCGDRVAIIPMRGSEASAVLAVALRDGTLATTPTYDALRQAIEAFKPDVVVIDTLADVFAGNENDRGHAKQFIKQIERLGRATFIVTAHPSVSGQADGRGASGSTGWPAAVRSHLYLQRQRGEEGFEPDPDVRILSNLKANYARAGEGEMEMRWTDGVFLPTNTRALEAFDPDKADAVFLKLLATYNARRMNVSASTGPTYAPAMFAKEDAARSARVTKKALVAAMGRLLDAERVANVCHRGGSNPRYHLEVVEPTQNRPS